MESSSSFFSDYFYCPLPNNNLMLFLSWNHLHMMAYYEKLVVFSQKVSVDLFASIFMARI